MTAPTAHLLNSLVLILASGWAYFAASEPSFTALIPAAFGVALLACLPGVRTENKVVAHIAVTLTLVVLIALVIPLRGALERGDALSILRVGAMMLTSVLAMVFFVKSFIDALRARG